MLFSIRFWAPTFSTTLIFSASVKFQFKYVIFICFKQLTFCRFVCERERDCICDLMKGDVGGKMIIKSKLKWVGLVGLVLSALSLFTHFLLARYSYTNDSITEYQAITIFSWRPIFVNADPIFLYFRQPGIDTTAAARTAAPVSQVISYLSLKLKGFFTSKKV